MSDGVDALVAQLRTIEESLRDLAYERLEAAAAGVESAAVDEKRLHQARRAVERAIHALDMGSER
jgi:hypothetical protein